MNSEENIKKILLIATGGTIASEQTEFGLSPKINPKEFLNHIPQSKELAQIDVKQVMNIDSTNIEPHHWLMIADVIKDNYEDYDGFIITHGTDTLAYSAAALSYLIQNSTKPIILTGSQRPITDLITDAKKNLLDSIRFAIREQARGVYIVFDGKAIIGTRAKKLRSKSYSAFDSINYPVAAFIDGNRILQYVEDREFDKQTVFYEKLNSKVFLLKLTPGVEPEVLEYISKHYDAIVIESYGVGGLPFNSGKNFNKVLEKITSEGKIVVIATQVMLEGSDATTYEVGFSIMKDYNVLEAYDMTVESAVTKLMWILGQTNNFEKVKELFYKSINRDLLNS
ncbi:MULTISPECIES: asparaginase [Peptoniphilus]|uniref:asparaginase n=1 Tax=Peptoniphilus TaxID=162289 RepID=UPI0001DAA42F|nr:MULTISPECIES: asparaginase [Peptoniphilus]EFI41341.1 L-asparaginase, type I [Peptoniphilus sp. oral taxon 386 str. F0131]